MVAIHTKDSVRLIRSPSVTSSDFVAVLSSISFALNYKGLKFRTEWIDYLEVEETCKKYGAPPTSKHAPHYTLPMIYDPSTRTCVVDSWNIAKYLDRAYPDTPRLVPPGTTALQAAFSETIPMTIMVPLFMNIATKIWSCLTPRSKVYFRESREAMFGGKPLETLYDESHWEECIAELGKVDAWIKTDDEAAGEVTFLGGDKPNHCDLTIVAMLTWARAACGSESDEWRRIMSWHGGRWGRMEKYFQQYAHVEES